MSLFLSDDEVRELSGRARRRAQIEWLRAAAIPFFVNAAGRPIVLRAQFTKEVPAAKAPVWTPAPARRA